MNSDLYSTHFTTGGYIAFWVSAVIIGTFIAVTFISFISKREIIRSQIKTLLFIFLAALSVWAFLWDPAPYYDSYKHFQWLNQIRNQKIGLLSFLKNGFNGSKIGNYYGLIGFNILRYIVVTLSSNNHMLPFLCTAIDYLIFYYVVIDFIDKEGINFTWLFVVWAMSFSFLSYFMVVSGIRNAFAASIAGLAIYNKLYKKHGYVEYVFLSVMAITIHPNVALPLLITIVYPLFKGIKSIFVLFFCILFLRFGYTFLQSSGIPFLSYVGGVIEFYIVDNQYHGEVTTYISDIIVIVCSLMLFARNRRTLLPQGDNQRGKVQNVGSTRCVQFVLVYSLAVLSMAFVGGTNFLTREGYVLGILSVFYVKFFSSLHYTVSKEDFPNVTLLAVIILASLANIGSEFLLLFAQFF